MLRTALLLLSLVVLIGCWFEDSEQADTAQGNEADADVGEQADMPQSSEADADVSKQDDTPQRTEAIFSDRDCVGFWPAAAPIPEPNLLSPTIEERVAGAVGVAIVRLESVSYDLPDRARNNRIDLGTVTLKFSVLEHLKTGYHVPQTVSGYMEVGYHCEYIENDDRDREALAELSATLEGFFSDRNLIVFLPHYGGFHMTGATITFRDKSIPAPPPVYGVDPLEQEYRLWRGWNDGSQWLLRAEGVGSDQDPHFVDPLDAPYRMDVPENTISLSEIRERVNAVIAEEEERGVECVGAHYKYQWYVRSNEESWYRGRVGSDGTPIECIEI